MYCLLRPVELAELVRKRVRSESDKLSIRIIAGMYSPDANFGFARLPASTVLACIC